MKVTEYRKDGWPLCPICGEDELGVLKAVNPAPPSTPLEDYIRHEMFCYQCGRVTVEAGEALENWRAR